MSRRKQESWVDDLFDLLAQAPVWLGPALAAVVFVGLRYVLPAVLRLTDGEIPVGQTLATIISPLASILAAGVLLVWIAAEGKKLLNRRMLDRQTGADSIRALSWGQFEQLVAEAFRRRGYVAEVVGRPSADGGIDIVLHGRSEKTLVQCKHWKAWQVGVKPVRELAGIVAAEKASRGILVTSGRFTRGAEAFAEKVPVELIDGASLAAMIAEGQKAPKPRSEQRAAARGAPSASSGSTSARSGGASRSGPPEAPAVGAPRCPICNGEMVKRTARRGDRAGTSFWGCSGFPACRGTRDTTELPLTRSN